ncbi:PTS IIA-like nitrogen-regulatory protein PtsN [Oceanococcus atlanticus]|uniref:PTS IIA-like nitrogen-regulatory protein PtsN n=1 Tax=Oceanococcus atlanticus TaxID=1317117 RepID=A0A1Y1SI87_9GAMM|nr:PTS IIA-like nitrogen regulatory protein PtsN [Oceanococcus atlanticus]ORE89110.1 PTS IIA-like nitrogen-regulatory protein PtsN [Oceanococcus atlanticus]
MNLAEFLKPSAVTINTDITSKKRALEEVSRLLTAHAELVSEKDVLTSLINREKLGSTGLGAGVAIPHGRLKGLESAVAAFVKLGQPIDYDANDEQPVDLVFGLLVPQEATAEHLQILAKIAEMFRDENNLAAIRQAGDSETVHKLLTSPQGA